MSQTSIMPSKLNKARDYLTTGIYNIFSQLIFKCLYYTDNIKIPQLELVRICSAEQSRICTLSLFLRYYMIKFLAGIGFIYAIPLFDTHIDRIEVRDNTNQRLIISNTNYKFQLNNLYKFILIKNMKMNIKNPSLNQAALNKSDILAINLKLDESRELNIKNLLFLYTKYDNNMADIIDSITYFNNSHVPVSGPELSINKLADDFISTETKIIPKQDYILANIAGFYKNL